MTTETRAGGDAWSLAIHETRASWREMLDRRAALPNVMAGVSTALVALPLNVALAIACGLPPSVGLVTGAVAGVVSALFGGSRLQVTGPEVALAPLTFVIVAQHGLAGLLVATFLAGLMQIALGLLRVGRLVYAIPAPVIGGFLAAVGLLVLDTQLPRVLGIEGVRALSAGGFAAIARAALPTLAIGAAAIAALVILPRIHRRIPAPLVAMGIGVSAVAAGVPTATLAPVEAAWPQIGLPAFGAVDLAAIAPKAAALAILASLDSLICALAMDARVPGARTRTDQELVAQGLANIASACVGGMPVAAAVVRSVAAHEAGATTRLAALTQSAMLAVILALLAPFTSLVPVAALSGILLVVGYRLVDLRALARTFRASRVEAIIFVATAVTILARDFVTGVSVGVVLAALDFARRNAELTVSSHAGRAEPAGDRRLGIARAERVLRVDGPLFFGSHTRVERLLFEAGGAPRLVIDLSGVPDADLTGASSLSRVVASLAAGGVEVHLRGASARLRPLLAEAHALAEGTRGAAPTPPPTRRLRVRPVKVERAREPLAAIATNPDFEGAGS